MKVSGDPITAETNVHVKEGSVKLHDNKMSLARMWDSQL